MMQGTEAERSQRGGDDEDNEWSAPRIPLARPLRTVQVAIDTQEALVLADYWLRLIREGWEVWYWCGTTSGGSLDVYCWRRLQELIDLDIVDQSTMDEKVAELTKRLHASQQAAQEAHEGIFDEAKIDRMNAEFPDRVDATEKESEEADSEGAGAALNGARQK